MIETLRDLEVKSARGNAIKRYELPKTRTGIGMMPTVKDDSYLFRIVG